MLDVLATVEAIGQRVGLTAAMAVRARVQADLGICTGKGAKGQKKQGTAGKLTGPSAKHLMK